MWRMNRNSPYGRDNDGNSSDVARERRVPRPLDAARLNEMGLAYVARFATSAGKLAIYLRRKLRERGWEGEAAPDIDSLIEKFVAAGYVDDAGFARAKAHGLMRRGYGARRIDQTLGAAGIAEDLRDEARGTEAQRRQAALTMARKRRFGPFAREGRGEGAGLDPATREKQVAALLRAGHCLDYARKVVNALSEQVLDEWIDEIPD